MTARKVLFSVAEPQEADGGATVTLDGRPLTTPSRSPFVVPTDSLAAAIAQEWQAQKDEIRPETMPLTRLANSAIDKIPAQFGETVTELASYAQTDMTCFRADSPQGLIDRQTASWDPALDWLKSAHGIRLIPTIGIAPVPQPQEGLDAFTSWLADQTPFALMGLHELIGLSGSIVLARAVAEGAMSPQEAWQASILEEMWNVEVWGEDEQAAQDRAAKQSAFEAGHKFFQLQTRSV